MRPMLSSALHVSARLGGTSPPPLGTGPLGAPERKRWITAYDVLAHHVLTQPWIRPSVWDLSKEQHLPLRPATPSTVVLRRYQRDAIHAAMPTPDSFRSGEIEIGCGLGKTFVGAELVRRSRTPAVVVTQHSLSVAQWADHFRDHLGLRRVLTLQDGWELRDPLPDVLVVTYQSLVRVSDDLFAHCERLAQPEPGHATETRPTHPLLWMLHCERFGVLVLDEVHIGVADHFRVAGLLRASVVYGLSGSMIREDDRLARMERLVGPKLFRYHADREMRYRVITVPLDERACHTIRKCKHRSALEQSVRALNPAKMAILEELLAGWSDRKVLVFCDARRAAMILHRHLGASSLLHGGVSDEERQTIVHRFSTCAGGAVLVTTRVCDAAIDFPPGCVIVQLYCASGSRQQEVQRAGRGSRGDETSGSTVVHLVNGETEEVEFVHRRVEHVAGVFAPRVDTRYEARTPNVRAHHSRPLDELLSLRTTLRAPTGGPSARRIRSVRNVRRIASLR